LDALVGRFGVNQPPTGSKDPFALRRQAIAVVRLCVEKGIRRPVFDLVDEAAHVYDRGFETGAVKTYLVDRFEQWCLDQGVPGDVVRAIIGRDDAQLCLCQSFEDMATLQAFKADPSAASLIQAQKRINNILEKTDVAADNAVDPSLFQHGAESDVVSLAQKMLALRDEALKDRLDVLAGGLPDIEGFFEHVLVMADDLAVRSNRLASLKTLRNAINQIADLSLLDPIK
jgi:glycyl-tRNA synthetase beta chain